MKSSEWTQTASSGNGMKLPSPLLLRQQQDQGLRLTYPRTECRMWLMRCLALLLRHQRASNRQCIHQNEEELATHLQFERIDNGQNLVFFFSVFLGRQWHEITDVFVHGLVYKKGCLLVQARLEAANCILPPLDGVLGNIGCPPIRTSPMILNVLAASFPSPLFLLPFVPIFCDVMSQSCVMRCANKVRTGACTCFVLHKDHF